MSACELFSVSISVWVFFITTMCPTLCLVFVLSCLPSSSSSSHPPYPPSLPFHSPSIPPLPSPTGCAFVTFSTRAMAQNAIKAMHQSQTMEVLYSRPFFDSLFFLPSLFLTPQSHLSVRVNTTTVLFRLGLVTFSSHFLHGLPPK